MIGTGTRHRLTLAGAAALVALIALVACGGSDAPAPKTGGGARPAAKTAQMSPEKAKELARKEYDGNCTSCHGKGGQGDGPGSAALNPKPRTFTDPEWQKSVTDETIKSAIVNGGAAVGKSAMMPAHPLLKSQPQVVDELVKIVRGFGASG